MVQGMDTFERTRVMVETASPFCGRPQSKK
jgi:hypothetical protein